MIMSGNSININGDKLVVKMDNVFGPFGTQ